ncbi:hypothetical protein BKN49_05575 [Pseudomonas aeruginosa]|nr:hypothetical protein BKN49_05575 [Pseudomonas aeruginosa]
MGTDQQLKNPIPLCILGPIPIVLLGVYSIFYGEGLDSWSLFLFIVLPVLGWGMAVYLYFWNRKLISQRVYLELKPNKIETSNGEVFHNGFSSADRLVADTRKLNDCIVAVATRRSHAGDRLFFARESAHVRIWPDGKGISELELHAIQDSFMSEFIDPVFEVADNNAQQSAKQTGIKA